MVPIWSTWRYQSLAGCTQCAVHVDMVVANYVRKNLFTNDDVAIEVPRQNLLACR